MTLAEVMSLPEVLRGVLEVPFAQGGLRASFPSHKEISASWVAASPDEILGE